MPGPYDRLLHDLGRVQARRAASLPTPRQLRKARGQLQALVGRAPLPELLPAFQRLRELEDETR